MNHPARRYFTVYWRSEAVDNDLRASTAPVFDHAASNHFTSRGISPGDVVYVLSLYVGQLTLVSRGVVESVVNQHEASVRLGTSDLWEARDHILVVPGTGLPLRRRVVSTDVVKRLRFTGKGGTLSAAVFLANGSLDRQTLRGARELTQESAYLLDQVLGTVPDAHGAGTRAEHEAEIPETDVGESQGYQSEPRVRKAIELHAMKLAQAYYTEHGYSVEVKGKPFDLLCRSRDAHLFVEVKGTMGRGTGIVLTRNEVDFARENASNMALFLVTNICVDSSDPSSPKASGGLHRVMHPWSIQSEYLSPLQYEYKIPPDEAE